MVVRIRYARPRPLPSSSWKQFALTTAALLTPCALVAFTMAFWIIASDMQWTGAFFLSTGLLARWQVWLCGAAVLLLLSRLLDRLSTAYSSPE
jgi:hypothetical protein